MKTKILLFAMFLAIIQIEIFPQKNSDWRRIPDNIKERKVFNRLMWDIEQRAYPYNTIPGQRYRQVRNQQIMKSKQKSTSVGKDCIWHSIGPGGLHYSANWGLVSGRVKAVAVHPTDPNTVYIGAASGGIWKTTDGGASWFDIGHDLESLNFGAIAIDPNYPETVYAGSGESCFITFFMHYDGRGLYKSTDGGQSWQIITDGFGEATHFSDIAVNPYNSNIVIAALASGDFFNGDTVSNEGIWKSSDAGLTWNRTLDGEDAYDILFHPGNPALVYATIGGMNTNSGFYISTDEGNTWTKSNAGLPVSEEIGRMQIDIAKSSPNILYSVIYQLYGTITQTTKAFKSVDGGANWYQISTGVPLGGYYDGWYDQGFYDLCIAVDPINPDHVFIGNVELHKTTNGSAFSPVRPFGNNVYGSLVHCDYHQLVYAPSNPSFLYIGCDGGIFKSTDGGLTASSVNDGLETLQFYRIASSPFDSLVFMGGMQDNANAITFDGGNTWEAVTGADGMECFFDYENPNIVYASIQFGTLLKSINGGSTFYLLSNVNGSWITPFFMHPTDHNTLYVASCHVFKNTGSGFMNIAANVVPTPMKVSTMDQSSVNPDMMILAAGGIIDNYPLLYDSLFRVKISDDGGYNWNDVTDNIPGEVRWIARVIADPVQENTMYVLRTGFSASNKLYKTCDLGLTWSNITGDLPDLPCNDVFVDPQNTNQIYVANDIGVYLSIDGGITWVLQNNGIPFVPVLDFDYSVFGTKRVLRIGTHGRSIFETTLSPLVDIKKSNENERDIRIYPSPANNMITIYSTTITGITQLIIYNVSGQKVLERQLQDSETQIDISALPRGVYFIRLQNEKMVEVTKLVKQ